MTPRKKASEMKTKTVPIKVTPKQHSEIHAAAKAEHFPSVSAYLIYLHYRRVEERKKEKAA
jgi:hypothetical protein